jgi:preprotein translocase subunit SecA
VKPGVKQIIKKQKTIICKTNKRKCIKCDVELYFVIDEKHNSVDMTEKGIDLITSSGTTESDFFVIPNVGGEIADLEKKTFADEKKNSFKRIFNA